MKTDNYLNLCLEQAALSPLRYLHGSIVVRGGKVIGQGYNDYRPGFDGGALKTGRLPLHATSTDGLMLSDQKKKRKLKRDIKEPKGESSKTFAPFEAMSGGGHLVNPPLSMHSEMMAIHVALAASSTLVRSAVSHQKPCFKLSGDSKRKARLRREAIKSYVQVVCNAAIAQSTGEQSQVQEWRLESTASGSKKSATKHRTKKKNENYHHHNPGNNHGNHKGKYQHHARDVSAIPITFASSKSKISPAKKGKKHDHTKLEAHSSSHEPHSKSTKAVDGKNMNAKSQLLLVPRGQAAQNSHSVRERTRNSRLNGADLYVARLGWQNMPVMNEFDDCCSSRTHGAAEVVTKRTLTGSLHDEIAIPTAPKPCPDKIVPTKTKRTSVSTSRPCYRCISYMVSVGIKCVFWTTDAGTWEGAKVRDLVDALDKIGEDQITNVSNILSNVFVTKHEVLMLRRAMGDC